MEKPDPPKLPVDTLHAALPHGNAGHATVDALNAEIQGPQPKSQAIEKHVGILRAVPEVEAIIMNWWDDPSTQAFVDDLIRIGL